MFQAAKNALEIAGDDAPLRAAMRTVYWIAKEDLPMQKYTSLMNFQSLQEVPHLNQLSVGGNATYTSRIAGEDLQECVAESIQQEIRENIGKASMFSILIDETTDISISKMMVVFVRMVDEHFIPHTHFLRDICIKDPKSDANVLFGVLTEFLDAQGLKLENVRGFGSDGASVMVGRHKGVAAKLRAKSPHLINIHCMAHRFNLCTSQASKNVKYFEEFERIIRDLYYHFGGSKSGNRKCELESIQKVLDEPQIQLKECHEIRWIAFYKAVYAIYHSWAPLVTYFTDHDRVSTKSGTPFINALTDFRFVSVLHLLMDILPPIANMSTILQKQDLDVAAVRPALTHIMNKIALVQKGKTNYQSELTEKITKIKDKHGNTTEVKYKGHKLSLIENAKKTAKEVEETRGQFCENLTRNINNRFPKESTDVATCFHVLGMRGLMLMSSQEQAVFGNDEIGILVDHCGKDIHQNTVVSKKLIYHRWSPV